jgi:CubicO group peptidase (beta-lactamase class C family)
VTDGDVAPLLTSALDGLGGDAVAVGAVVADHLEIGCRGALAGVPVQGSTVFYAASVTKQLVGMAAAQAVLGGVLSIDDPVVRWLPELPAWMETIRLDHLVHHTSGLPDLADPARGLPTSNADVVDRFRQVDAMEVRPGDRFAYNNAGYVLLAEVIARCRRQPIDRVLSRLVRPLAVGDTSFAGAAVSLETSPDPPATIGDGGLWTSVRDLLRWLQAANRSELGAEAQRISETTTTLTDGSPVSYAWGVRVVPHAAGRLITHGGSWHAWLAKTARIPEQHVAVAILSLGSSELEVSRAGTDLADALASL